MDNKNADDSTFERQILRFLCVVGIVRMLIEFYSNFLRASTLYGWSMDILLISVLGITLLLSFSDIDFRLLIIPFSVLVMILLSISWINTGGVYGRSEYNYFGLIIGLAMINSGRRLVWMLGISFSWLCVLIIIWEFHFSILEAQVLSFTEAPFHFIAIVIVGTLFVYYLRFLFDEEKRKLETTQLDLSRRAMELDIENAKLLSQQKEYESINHQLEQDIKERRLTLESQNKSLREFIEVSMREFYPPLVNTIGAIDDIGRSKEANENIRMLQKSRQTLEQAYESLREKMKTNLR